ncbi:uncharacterized protein JN550_000629 [Neoarthrinium moseri]|uniref:uncharacterized protein n=1 Tax=Neoarthrinium moseri TaxID=1658444 RepID=UPI001FDBAC87|nr:uncharacterized protein JN550_000629 [Neoarthrinium moseri]KAI1878447.1 hypothetical protein JN550_000629 [Neoarthrinium moseri]
MLFDLLAAVKALGHLMSLGVLDNPTSLTQSSVSGNSVKSTVNVQDSAVCGDIMNEANVNGTSLFWASDVYACLRNVPFSIAPALRFLDYFNTTIQFQSTLAFLKNPPQGYQQPPVNVDETLQRIKTNVKAGYYMNQYDFEADVQRLVFAMHDAHVHVRSGILSPFSFGSQWAISSVSVDGKKTPSIYLTDDILQAQEDNWRWTPSAITKINGEDVIDYLTKFASANSLGRLEGHAEWNDLMSHPAQDVLGRDNIWTGDATFYPGDQLNFSFENKSDTLQSWWVSFYDYGQDTGPIANGGDFYNFFVLGIYPATNESESFRAADSSVARRWKPTARRDEETTNIDETSEEEVVDPSWNSISFGAYPEKPDIYQPDLLVNGSGVVTGYFLPDISTGVLSLPTFKQYGDELYAFSETVQKFIDGAVKKKIDHVVIDLQQNSGGDVVLAFDTFSRFFPEKGPFAGSRRRGHEMGRVLGNATTTWWSRLDPNSDNDEDVDDWWEGLADEWIITPRLKAETRRNFQDWEDYAGPKKYLGDDFTVLEEYNLSDENFTYQAMDMSPYGYADNPSNTTQKWDPKDIVLLTDGLCSSTCSMFVEFMTRMGVRTIVMGGRPDTGPMQAASGTRGARAYTASSLDNDLAWAGHVDTTANRTFPAIPINGQYRDSGMWAKYVGINLRDQIREDEMEDDDAVPLQFKYEAADCRLYYTMHNIYNMTRQWRDVAAAAWDDTSLCVKGSTGYSTTGQNKPKNKPPATSAEADYHSVLGDGYTSPADAEVLSSLEFAAGNLLDDFPPSTELQECYQVKGDPDWHCKDSRKVCLKVNVRCPSTRKKKSTAKTPIRVCVQQCRLSETDSSCADYDDVYGMTCAAYTQVEQKASAELMGQDDTVRETKKFKAKVLKWQNVCKPKYGTKEISQCPA